jgi:tRNA-splicing ligase RtcB
MVHSGSTAIGHLAGGRCRDLAKGVYPEKIKHPENKLFAIPEGHPSWNAMWDHLNNAANFAQGNRLFLALLALEALEAECGVYEASLLWDAPHNFVWPTSNGKFLHRKGACPADSGRVVLVPGSMGSSSYIMVGLGNEKSLSSASHGAGRALNRGSAMKIFDADFRKFLADFRVVTPVDFNRPDIKSRRDIVARKLEDIKQEAPFAYKGIGPVVKTLTDAEVARPVAELRPIMTIKG